LAYTGAQLEDARAFIDRALQLDPNLAAAWHFSGWVSVYLGETERAIEHQSRAMRLSPFDPLRGNMQAATAYAHLFAGRYEATISCARCDARTAIVSCRLSVAAASNALAGRLNDANYHGRLREADPSHRIIT
jgi:tetratricopeptide (TPR) repeat protein